MTARDPDRIPAETWRRAFPTVERMIEGRWEVFAVCEACDLKADVSLVRIAKLAGPGLSLWGARRGCVRRGCDGRMGFRGKPPRRSAWIDLTRPTG